MIAYLLLLAMDVHQSRIPVHFEPNQGQVGGAETEWIARARGGTMYIKDTAIAFETREPNRKPRIIRFVGASRAEKPTQGQGLNPTGGYSNYFDGRDETHWRSGIPHYSKVKYQSLYKGIDLIFYATKDGQIEYDLEAAPGADLTQIELAFEGFDRIDITPEGDLALHSGSHVIRQHRARVLQHGEQINCSYKLLNGNHVKLTLDGYDDALPLTIDPVLDFSTYLGGPGNDSLRGVALDNAGNVYVSGYSETPANPSLNPFQQTNTVIAAPFVAKLTPNADKILYYSTLRSSGSSDATGLALDPSGSPVLLGRTTSTDFPLKNAFQKDYSASYYAGFVAKFAADGRTLVYSSYYGGSGGAVLFAGILDKNGALVFSGNTSSRDIPIRSAFQPKYGGGQADCFVAKVDANGALVFSTYFGGSETDYCYGAIAIDSTTDSIYFGGTSYSDDLSLKNAIQTVRSPRNGYPTAFIARLSAQGGVLEYSTFLGGQGSGVLGAIALNSKNEIYLAGSSYGNPWTSVNAFQDRCDPDVCGIVMKLDPTGQKILASTMFSGSGRSGVDVLAIGPDDAVYLAGSAGSSDFPSVNSLFPFLGGGFATSDVFVAKFLTDMRTLVYSTFLGGNNYEKANALAFDAAGRLYIAGGTSSTDFPVQNAFQKTHGGGGGDGFLARLSDSSSVVASPLTATPGQVQLRYVQGGAAITPQNIQIAASDAPVRFTASANASWVTVLPQSGTTPATLSIGASPLAPGNYAATVIVTPASGAPLSIPVSLKILTPAPQLTSVEPSFVALGSDDTTITFHGSGFTPQTQLLLVGANVWGYPVVYVDGQTLQTTMPYLTFIYEGSYPFAAVNPQSDVSGTVTVSIGRLTPAISSVVNAASQLSGPVTQGELLQITGSNFGPAAQLTITVGGILATVVSSSDTQALVIVPPQVQGAINASVILTSGTLPSLPAVLTLAPVAPGLFTVDGSGTGQALISGTATPGSTITLYATGVGDLSLPVTVSINGEDAPVSSVSPVEDKPGWFQVVITVPTDIATDAPATVVLSVGGQPTQPGVTLSVQVNE